MDIPSILRNYNQSELTLATLGSHSALDISRGAKDHGLHTLVVCQKGREMTYNHYYKTHQDLGCVDSCLILHKFSDILDKQEQNVLRRNNAIFIPHRSFEVYLDFNYDAIENQFKIPIFGNRFLLKLEERGREVNQYSLLSQAGIRYPVQFSKPEDIDRLCLVKVLEKDRGYERAFFLVESFKDYQHQVENKLRRGIFTQQQLEQAVIEEFVIGVHVNLNFFYSPLRSRLEFLGCDTRRQTNFDGIVRLPALYQNKSLQSVSIQYEEASHQAVTILESLLEKVYELGEKFIKTCTLLAPPGIIGPFTLQTIIVPGPPKKEFVVIDVSLRVPGSPGIWATPYTAYLYGKHISVGDRIALEIQTAVKEDALNLVVS